MLLPKIKYDVAKTLIEEADVLLFRGDTIAEWLIKKYSGGIYSHVGMASHVYNKKGEPSSLEIIEFSEWNGSRAISLENYVNDFPDKLDVFRVASPQYNLNYDLKTMRADQKVILFKKHELTKYFRSLTGLPYGWKRIWQLAKIHLPIIRMFTNGKSVDDKDELIYPVCSSAVAHVFSKKFVDLTHFRSDNRVEPNDIARSPILFPLFTLIP